MKDCLNEITQLMLFWLEGVVLPEPYMKKLPAKILKTKYSNVVSFCGM